MTRSGEIEHARNVRNSSYSKGNSNNSNINNNNKAYSTPAKSNKSDKNKTYSTPAKNNSNSCTLKNGEDIPTNKESSPDNKTKGTDNPNVVVNQDIPSSTIGEGESKLAKLLPSAETVVSSTTSTATQPLKIQTDLDMTVKEVVNSNGPSLYLPDASDLRPMSVSNAMNRMNNTVLDSKTLMRETDLSFKLSPAAITAVSTKEEAKNNGATTFTVSSGAYAKSSIPTPVISPTPVIAENGGSNKTLINIISSTDNSNVLSVNSKTKSVYNSVNSSGEHSVGLGTPVVSCGPQKSANGRIREARTIVAADVKPIKITVREKPADFEVQSGNVRIPIVANGVDDRPG